MSAAWLKRAFDIGVALVVLIVLTPLLLIVAVAVKLSSPGPLFFRQERVGRHGRPFRIFKFRTMVVDAVGPNVSATHDRRITRVGALLRRSFVDEAPQLLNVLKGDMSLVGPRPETPEYAALLTGEERRIFEVRPGMTGPSTLTYSAQEAEILSHQDDPDRYYRDRLLHERVAADLSYLQDTSLARDVRILLGTAGLVGAGLGVLPRRLHEPSH
jgi:lipopolysaccharide/colanic/teichoic acid biosynthesis glycosyltransferase